MGNSDSRAEFRGLIESLGDSTITFDDLAWSLLWSTSLNNDDIVECIQASDVRQWTSSNIPRVQLLLQKSIEKMEQILSAGTVAPELVSEILNMIRIITRCLPFFMDDDKVCEELFWSSYFKSSGLCIAEKLVCTVMRLVFCPGFTIDATTPQQESDQAFDVNMIWGNGLFSTDSLYDDSHKLYIQNRSEILKLLLILQSGILFQSLADDLASNRWAHLVSCKDYSIPYRPELVFSLLNVVCLPDSEWRIPMMSSNTLQVNEAFRKLALENLAAILMIDDSVNLFKDIVKTKIRTASDFNFLFVNFLRLLDNIRKTNDSYISSTVPDFDGAALILICLWKLLTSNPAFYIHVCKHESVGEFVCILNFLLWRSRNYPQYSGLIQIATFLLLLLSGEQNFGVALNQRYHNAFHLDDSPALHNCSIADFMVVSFHKLIVSRGKQYDGLFNCFYTIIFNISSYIESFGKLGADRLFSLFSKVSTVAYLRGGPRNFELSLFMLDVFTNIVQYQYRGNANMVYALCLGAKSIETFTKLSFRDFSMLDNESKPFITEEWFLSWRKLVDARTVIALLDYLVPKLESELESLDGNRDAILKFVACVPLEGVLPALHPIAVRKYTPNQHTSQWFATFMWGLIYMNHLGPPLWDATRVKLVEFVGMRHDVE